MTESSPGPRLPSFASPSNFVAIPRVSTLALSPSGQRLIASISELDDKGGRFISSLWNLDPAGEGEPRRLTHSQEGETAPGFLPDDSLLFLSARPAAKRDSAEEGSDPRPALWMLPVGGGDALRVAARPGGVAGFATGRRAFTVVVAAKSAPGAVSEEQDRQWWQSRRDQRVGAALFSSLPVRYWDHYLGPDEVHLYAANLDPSRDEDAPQLRDLTPDAGQALFESGFALTPDGATVLVNWAVPIGGGHHRWDIVAIDTATGARRTLAAAADGSFDYDRVAVSPDGHRAVAVRTSHPSVSELPVVDLWVLDLPSGSGRSLSLGDGPHVTGAAFDASGAALIVSAESEGRVPLFAVDIESGTAQRLTQDGKWSSPQASPDGRALFVLSDRVNRPPLPVRLELPANAATPRPPAQIRCPGEVIPAGRLEEVTARADDGTRLRAWLALPDGAAASSPAPLLLFIHGGPLNSWNGWHWRWNPWLMAAAGWAVLMPDPALSTGYGAGMIQRGWGQWGGAPFDDLMRLTDAALTRPDLDASRTAALGGSYGGYMANWIAGHTDRFGAIVSHSSLWSMEQFQGTTDWPASWAEVWGYPDTNPELYRAWSPDLAADAIRTPMLLIHGERDYRCPIGESLRLWSELVRRAADARFLWFRDENHWIVNPGDIVVWYETVLAFLAQHVLGRPWEQPPLL